MSTIECAFDLSRLPVQMDPEQFQQLCDSLAETAEEQYKQLKELPPAAVVPPLKSQDSGTEEEA